MKLLTIYGTTYLHEAMRAATVLINHDYVWINNSQPLRYSFTVPNNISSLTNILELNVYSGLFFAIRNISEISKTDITSIKTAVSEISQYINLTFIEDNKSFDLRFVSVTASPTSFLRYLPASLVNDPPAGVGLTEPHTGEKIVTYSAQVLQTDDDELIAKKDLLIRHEICHTIGFRHPIHPMRTHTFRGDESFNFFSVMVYEFLHLYFQDRLVPVIPKTLMPYDIYALQHLYGVNLETNKSDNVYELKHYADLSDNFMTAYTIWDSGGEDTLSARGQEYDVVLNLREGSHYYSNMNSTFIVLAFGANIENAIGGNKNNLICLNELSNKVDIRETQGAATIVINPEETSNDIVFGFDTKKDTIILQAEGNHKNPNWKIMSVALLNLTFMSEVLFYKFGVKLLFDEYNSLLLPGIKLDEISWEDIQLSNDIKLPYAIKPSLSTYEFEYPEMMSIVSPFIQSMLYIFANNLLENILVRKNWSLRLIKFATQTLQAILAFYQGSYLASFSAFSMDLLSKRYFPENNSKQIGSTTAILIATLPSMKNPLLSIPALIGSSLLGGEIPNTTYGKNLVNKCAYSIEVGVQNANVYLYRFGLWTRNKIKNYNPQNNITREVLLSKKYRV